uniref:DNA methylase n=1 Tax=Candidatus Kentrum sp. MB TaxID=2138164 RepID=A0A450X2F0_9GAMM|nr:MAG: DNA methylase [Candidatus Kentron sp. MB]VFK27865.1 MAG: DNA methylase [Candidatus Kentron sp. MB]VFK74445.1 MAG: DNA methylase [Candidatus Kentron sp. MB]
MQQSFIRTLENSEITGFAYKKKRKVINGKPTNDLVLSAYDDGNCNVFPRILELYVKEGSTIADVTYGKGAFWKNVRNGAYNLLATDITGGIDCRDLPYDDGSLDCVVFDPPYMHTPGGTAHSSHFQFEIHYRNNETGNNTSKKYHEAVLELYVASGKEAYRVLKERGIIIAKCQDEVCSNRQRFTHIEIVNEYEKIGFIAEDIFVVIRRNKPGVSRVVRQIHARKNHSYFVVFWKPGAKKRIWEAPL